MPCLLQTVSELRSGGGLACTVHANEHDDHRGVTGGEGLLDRGVKIPVPRLEQPSKGTFEARFKHLG